MWWIPLGYTREPERTIAIVWQLCTAEILCYSVTTCITPKGTLCSHTRTCAALPWRLRKSSTYLNVFRNLESSLHPAIPGLVVCEFIFCLPQMEVPLVPRTIWHYLLCSIFHLDPAFLTVWDSCWLTEAPECSLKDIQVWIPRVDVFIFSSPFFYQWWWLGLPPAQKFPMTYSVKIVYMQTSKRTL